MGFVNFVDLNSANVTRVERRDVDTIQSMKMAAWLGAALHSQEPLPLPDPQLSDYVAKVASSGDALMVVVARKAENDREQPSGLATLGVARNAVVGAELWQPMSKGLPGAVVEATAPPAAPWVALSKWKDLDMHPQAEQWLRDAGRTIGWVWTQQERLLSHSAEDLTPAAPAVPRSAKEAAEIRAAAAMAWAATSAAAKSPRHDGPSLER